MLTLLALLLMVQATSTPVAGPPPSPPIAEGTSAISGHVRDADTGAAIAGARVRLTAITRRSDEEITASNDASRFVIRARAPQAEATTDHAGRYEFSGIAAGDYLLGAQSRGYVMALYGSLRWPSERALVPVALEAGQHLNRIDLALKAGGSVRGRVVDETGRPLGDARVIAVASQDAGLRMNPVLAAPTPTDDDGRYTIEGVPEGHFLVQAVPRPDSANPGAGSQEYLPTYYPSAADPSGAVGIVGKGVVVTHGIDITVRRKPIYSITGTVLTAGGEILEATEVVLESVPPGVRYHVGGPTLGEGAFSFGRLNPGRYILWARSPVADGFEAAALSLTLSDSLTDVHLLLLPTGAIMGRVQGERGGTIPDGLSVVATLADGAEEAAAADQATVTADGAFTIDRLFGQRNLQVSGLPDDWTIKRILVGRFEVAAPHVTVPPGATVDNVQIVIGRRD
jgi:protocatechuate 3,4-dioxygenase beta subunit